MDSTEISVSSEDIYARARTSDRPRFEKFLEAIANLPQPPCVGCPFKRRCATKLLACEMFYAYVNEDKGNGRAWDHKTPPTRKPSRAMYLALDDDNVGQQIRPRKKAQDVSVMSEWEIRQIRDDARSIRQIAKDVGLGYSTVQRIKARTVRADVI